LNGVVEGPSFCIAHPDLDITEALCSLESLCGSLTSFKLVPEAFTDALDLLRSFDTEK
jgi:hypothetical protein